MKKLYKVNKIGYAWYVGLVSMFISFAMGMKLGDVNVRGAENMNTVILWIRKLKASFVYDQTNNLLTLCMLTIAIAVLARREYSRRSRNCSFVFSICTSVLLVIARSFYKKNSLILIFKNSFTMTKATIIIAGYAILIYYLVNAFFETVLPRLLQSKTVQEFLPKRIKIRFWTCFAAIMIAWTPYMVVYYPANFCRDARDEIAQTIGDKEVSRTANSVIYPKEATTLLNNHHPITYTLLVGGAAKLGFAIDNINLAIFLLALLQMIALAMIYSYCVNYLGVLRIPPIFQTISLGFFMFFPLIPMYAFTITKDSLYGGFMILVTIQLFKMIDDEDSIFESKKEKWLMFGSCLGLMLFRNNGLYILFVVIAILLVRYRKSKEKVRSVLFMIGTPIILYWILLLKILLPLFYIPGGSPREMLSVPFQQVARYAKEWGEEGFEEGEIEILDKILCFDGDIKVLAKRYNPVLSDPVKNKFNKYYKKEELKDFMGVWAKLLVRHPGTFVEATLNNTYYLFSADYDRLIVYNGVSTKGEWYGLHNIKALSPVRTAYFNLIKGLAKTSMLGWAFSVGPWNYLFLLCILYVIYKGMYQYLILTLPVVINVLICFAGPVCYMRYAIEWIVVFPVFGAMVWTCLKGRKSPSV